MAERGQQNKREVSWTRRGSDQKRFIPRGFAAVCLLIFTLFAFQHVARAEVYLLNSSGGTLYVGETLVLSDYFDQDELGQIIQESLQYAVADGSEGADCIELAQDGRITALKEGSVTVNVSYQQAEDSAERTEVFVVTVISHEQVSAVYGEKIWLAAFNMYSPYVDSSLPEGDDGAAEYSYTFANDSVVLDESGDGLIVQGFQDVSVYLEKNQEKILVAQITIKLPKFKSDRMARATATEAFYPELENCTLDASLEEGGQETYSITPVWSVEDEKIVELSEAGFLAIAIGSTKITAEFTAENGDELSLTLTITVTDPKLTASRVVLAVDVTKKLPVSGTCSDSTYLAGGDSASNSYNEEDGMMLEFQYAYLLQSTQILGKAKGTEKVVLIVDGRELSITFVVTDPRFNKNTFTLYKGLKKTVPIKGLNQQYSTITYTSNNTAIATVTSAGEVTAKGVGTAKIKIKADGRSFFVWVEVSTKKAYQAAKKEIAISKKTTQYSQAKRMSKGFYDCSSLVSRVYRQFGVYFGSKSGWSPTAAAIGQWCANNGKVIAKKAVPYTKLVPGDLIFYSYTKNGRYRNISHIEMYVGNGMSVSASSSRNAVVHYDYSTYATVLVARPTK